MFNWLGNPKAKKQAEREKRAIRQQITDLMSQFESLRFTDYTHKIDVIDKIIELGEHLLSLVPDDSSSVRVSTANYLIGPYDERARYHSHYGYYHEYGKEDHLKNIQQAINDYSRIIQLAAIAKEEPKSDIYQRRCECYLERRLFDDALIDANRVIELLDNSEAYLSRGRYYYAIGNYDRAKADAVYAMEIAKHPRDAWGAFEAYRQVCSDVVTEHERNLQQLKERYKAGERDFGRMDLSWTDLTDINLEGADLSGANLESCILIDVNLSKAILRSANLRNTLASRFMGNCKVIFDEADLQEANLRGAIFLYASFRKADLRKANLHKAILHSADLHMAKLQGAVLHQADLSEARMTELELVGVDFREAVLEGVYLQDADLRDARLNGANLRQAHLMKANLTGADLTQSNLFEAELTEAILKRADLSKAYLCQAQLQRADLEGANFRDANLRCAHLIEANINGANLVEADDLYLAEGIPQKLEREWRKRHKSDVSL